MDSGSSRKGLGGVEDKNKPQENLIDPQFTANILVLLWNSFLPILLSRPGCSSGCFCIDYPPGSNEFFSPAQFFTPALSSTPTRCALTCVYLHPFHCLVFRVSVPNLPLMSSVPSSLVECFSFLGFGDNSFFFLVCSSRALGNNCYWTWWHGVVPDEVSMDVFLVMKEEERTPFPLRRNPHFKMCTINWSCLILLRWWESSQGLLQRKTRKTRKKRTTNWQPYRVEKDWGIMQEYLTFKGS